MKRTVTHVLIALVVVLGACTRQASVSSTSATTTTERASTEADCPTEGEELETAKLYIEHNATDADTGVHGLFGGSAWRELCIWDPSGQLILVTDPQGALGELGVSDLFFESREPTNDEYAIEVLQADFPAGEYRVAGTDFEGVARVATAFFTHDIPAEPTITSPELAADEESADPAVDPGSLVIAWDPVTEALDGGSVTITGYEVIVTKVDHDDPNGWSRPIYDVHVGPETTSLPVPREFVEPGTLYELEVLALEMSGNQTICLGFFTTAGG